MYHHVIVGTGIQRILAFMTFPPARELCWIDHGPHRPTSASGWPRVLSTDHGVVILQEIDHFGEQR
jgi:hypothetical protein